MKILKYLEDKDIDHQVREYGLQRLAKKINVSTSLISQATNHKCAISEEVYLKIKGVL